MDNQPKKTTPPADTELIDLMPSRFIRVTDFTERWNVTEISVSIRGFMVEETIPLPADIDHETRKPRIVNQPVIYFKDKNGKDYPRGYLVSSKADMQALRTFGHTVGDLFGKVITIKLDTHRNKAVMRIQPNTEKAALNS